ncbi:RAVE subunit 2/Rogdi [Gongronella butleri]|nr:RAVE subunit 2/Rogdi [Gongronella butleri]
MQVCDHDQAMARQRTWLLQTIQPGVLTQLTTHLEASLAIISDTSKIDALPLSSMQNESIKGYINFGGTGIQKGEIQVRLPNYHSDTPTRTSISMPYILEQAQQCKNYIILANNKVKSCQEITTKQHAVQFFDTMCRLMDCALHALDYPNESALFPYKVCHPKFFSPPLKQDLVIEFCINDVYLMCNVYAIENAHATSSIRWDHKHHHQVTYKDKVTEILDETRAQTQSPLLTNLKGNLTAIRDLCQTYKRSLLQMQAK